VLAAAVGSHHVAEANTWHLTAAPSPDSLMWNQLGPYDRRLVAGRLPARCRARR
jgi:hypothetical protein